MHDIVSQDQCVHMHLLSSFNYAALIRQFLSY